MRIGRWAVLVCLFPLCAGGQTHHRKRHAGTTHSVSKLRGRLQSVRNKKAALRAQLQKTKHQAHLVLGDIRAVDQRLSDVKERLDRTSDRLDSSRDEQKHLGQQLDEATVRVALVKEQVRRRLRAMYIRGTGSVLTALVDTESTGDLASRGFLMRTVAKKDQSLFAEFRALHAQIADKKQRQDRLVVQIGSLAASQRAQSTELAQARQEKGELLEGLRHKQGELQSMIEQFESDEREIGAQIAAFASRPHRPGTPGAVILPAFHGRFNIPVNGARIADGFGMRYHPILHRTRMHDGVDFAAPQGTPIHAAADGQVISTSYMRGYGNVVILDHGGGVSTVYGHCSRIYCSPGQRVTRGEAIAAVGATGLATGPHCHFEVRIGGHAVNPMGHI